ncbi:MAG: TfoX/Sxy family protein [Bacteroidetes bacterium]|nr:TfoX/Sxy family protein [Bacteroidota bacterium]
MTYNEKLADRTREIISLTQENVDEKLMFGGVCFMVNDKMCLGVIKERLMVRLAPEKYEEVLEIVGCTPFDFSGKAMKGFVYVETDVLVSNEQLTFWVNLALDYNKIAKTSKKK